MVGMLSAVGYSIYDNRRYLRVGNKDPSGFAPPEARLPPAMLGGLLIPIGLFWFAFTDSPSLPYAASVCAGVPFGAGMVLIFLAIFNYLIDSYVIFAASVRIPKSLLSGAIESLTECQVLAANSVLRSLFGAAFPLFTKYMYQVSKAIFIISHSSSDVCD